MMVTNIALILYFAVLSYCLFSLDTCQYSPFPKRIILCNSAYIIISLIVAAVVI